MRGREVKTRRGARDKNKGSEKKTAKEQKKTCNYEKSSV